jgi:phage recombination protein Bet
MPKEKQKPLRRASKTARTKQSLVIPAKLEPSNEPQNPPSTAIQLSKATGPAALALRQTYSNEEIALMKQTVAAGTTDTEFAWFLYVAKQRALNPLTRQIHCVKRKKWSKDDQTGQWVSEDVMTIQTGIDGYRLIAARAGVIPTEDPPLWEGEGEAEFRCTVYVKKWAHGGWHRVAGVAYYTEFVQLKKDGNKWVPNSMWQKMPHSQLAKCAEALADRRAAPEGYGDIYVDEEMEHLDHVDQTVSPETSKPSQQARSEKKTGAVSSIKESAEPNRGHDNEGLKADEPNILAQDGEHKIAKSAAGIVTFHKDCSDCNKLLVSYMKSQRAKKGESRDDTPASTEKAEKTQPEEGKSAAEPGSGKRADSFLISGTTLLAANRKETSRGQRFAELDFDDMKGNKPPTKARVYNWHKSLDPLIDKALKKKCDICIHTEAKQGEQEVRLVLDDFILINGVAYEKGQRVDKELDEAIGSFAKEHDINLDAEPA